MTRLADEQTDCCRLLHGTQEGQPGITLDRYGELFLLQTFHTPIPRSAVEAVGRVVEERWPTASVVYNERTGSGSRVRNRLSGAENAAAVSRHLVREHGVRFQVKARHRGHDPWLFLDLRSTRRAVMDDASGASVLNLFAYTCGVGVCAAVAGATRVLNVDFATSSLAVGSANAALNGVEELTDELHADVFPVIRQLSGIRQPPVRRGRRLPGFPHVTRERFDLVVLDPPTLSKSPFGVVDLVRDYQSILKPTLGAVSAGGILYCTNHVARMDETDWHTQIRRCAEKHGRPIRSFDVIRPDADFPSGDGRPPLKVVRLTL